MRSWSGLRWPLVSALAAALVLASMAGCGGAPAASKSAAGATAPAKGSSPTPSSAPAKPATKLTHVVIAIPAVSESFTVQYLAKDLGFFKQQGLAATIETMKFPVAAAGMLTGSVTFSTASTSVTRLAEEGHPYRIVFISEDGGPFALVSAKNITRISQLRGKTVTLKSATEQITVLGELVLQRHGLPIGSYKYLNGGSTGAQLAELTKGIAQATVVPLHLALKLESQGYHDLANTTSILQPSSGLGTAASEVTQHPAVVRGAVAAMLQATSVFENDPSKVYPVMEKELHISSSVARKLYAIIKPITVDGRPTAAAVKSGFAMDRQALTATHIKFSYPFDQSKIFDFSFLPTK